MRNGARNSKKTRMQKQPETKSVDEQAIKNETIIPVKHCKTRVRIWRDGRENETKTRIITYKNKHKNNNETRHEKQKYRNFMQ